MASTIKVDNVQNQPGTNIINKCSVTTTIGAGAGETVKVCAATVTLGRCGGTVSLASGATQSGFGRTGTVDWDTSIHTGTVTGATGKGYFVNSTAGEITVNLPAAAVGSIVGISDYASTANTNNIIVSPNGSDKINGENEDYKISTNGLAVTLVYADATRGWKSVTGSDADATGVGAEFVVATGGTPCAGAIVCTNYKVHTFTGPGTFCVSAAGNACGSNTIDYLVVAGGGGGGHAPGGDGGGAGGAGGLRASPGTASGCYTASPRGAAPAVALPVTATGYPVAVGAGGVAGSSGAGGNGGDSVLTGSSTITATGGGGGGENPYPGQDGGSGGGAGGGGGRPYTGGNGNTPPTNPVQGMDGGANPPSISPDQRAGGGGGAICEGSPGIGGTFPSGSGGPGGAGAGTAINPSPSYGTPGPSAPLRYFAGGGGGSAGANTPGGTGGDGGGGLGGHTAPNFVQAVAGTVNTGGGGGGAAAGTGVAGGSGIVIIRYKFQ